MLVGKGLDRNAAYDKHSDGISLSKQRYAKVRTKTAKSLGLVQCVVGIGENVDNLHRLTLQLHAPDNSLAARRKSKPAQIVIVFLRISIARGGIKAVLAVAWAQDLRLVGLAEASRGFDKSLQNGPQIEGRATDDLQHIRGGGLLLQRFTQLTEQAHVLDRDDRLIGECF